MKQFFKKLFATIYDLFIDSNRWIHFIVGGILAVLFAAFVIIWQPYNPNAIQAVCSALFNTFIVMCAVEYKDKAKGGVFDWKDILAGITPALIMDILCLILLMFK